MYEDRHARPLPATMFAVRMARHVGVAAALVLLSLLIGMAGYEHYERVHWRDAFLNTAIRLGGMGPVDAPHPNGGKMFGGTFALLSDACLVVVAAPFLAPVVHRIMHRF